MKAAFIYFLFGLGYSACLMIVHKPKRQSATLLAFVEAVTTSGLSLKEIATALGYDFSQFAKILRGEPSHKLDIERFEGRLPYAVAQRFIPRLAEIALSSHMQQSAAVMSSESERA